MSKSIKQTLKERNKTHGNFAEQFTTAQAMKDELRHVNSLSHLSAPQREAVEMICTKLSRLVHGNPDHQDTWHDIAGYATLIADSLEEE